MNKVIKKINEYNEQGKKFFDIVIEDREVTFNIKCGKQVSENVIINGVGVEVEKFSHIEQEATHKFTAFRFSKTTDGYKCSIITKSGRMVFGVLKEVKKIQAFAYNNGKDTKINCGFNKTIKNKFKSVIEVAEKKIQQI